MQEFEKVSIIKNCTLEQLFDFHLDVSNLKNITPPDTKVELLDENFIPHEGGIMNIKTIKNYISTIWQVKIEKLEKPNLLVDKALKSPFDYWEHSHVFTQKGNVCQLKDIIKYKLPFGRLGELFDIFVQNELQKMFDFRHEITKKLIAEKNLLTNKKILLKNSAFQ